MHLVQDARYTWGPCAVGSTTGSRSQSARGQARRPSSEALRDHSERRSDPPDAEAHGRENRVIFIGPTSRGRASRSSSCLARVHARPARGFELWAPTRCPVRWLLRRAGRPRGSRPARFRRGGSPDRGAPVGEGALRSVARPRELRDGADAGLRVPTPVVASDIEGYRTSLPPETSVLVPPGDVGALEQALVELLGDEGRRRRWAMRPGFSPRTAAAGRGIAARLVEIYEGPSVRPAHEAIAAWRPSGAAESQAGRLALVVIADRRPRCACPRQAPISTASRMRSGSSPGDGSRQPCSINFALDHRPLERLEDRGRPGG